MKDVVLEYSMENWSKFGLKEQPTKIDFFVKNKYRKVTFFMFDKNKPFGMAKCTPYPRNPSEILNEFKILQFVNSKLNKKLKNTVPLPIAMKKIDNIPVIFQNFLDGEVMKPNTNLKTTIKNITLTTNWLIEFNKCLKPKKIELNKLLPSLKKNINQLTKIDNSFSIKDFEGIIKSFDSNNTIPTMPKHTDLWPGNIILEKNKIKILDWEDFGLSENPLYDMFHFLVSYFLEINGNELKQFRMIFFTKTKYTNLIKQSIDKFCKDLKINNGLVDQLFMLYLIELYNIRFNQEGENYSVTIRTKKFIKIYLKQKDQFILK